MKIAGMNPSIFLDWQTASAKEAPHKTSPRLPDARMRPLHFLAFAREKCRAWPGIFI